MTLISLSVKELNIDIESQNDLNRCQNYFGCDLDDYFIDYQVLKIVTNFTCAVNI